MTINGGSSHSSSASTPLIPGTQRIRDYGGQVEAEGIITRNDIHTFEIYLISCYLSARDISENFDNVPASKRQLGP